MLRGGGGSASKHLREATATIADKTGRRHPFRHVSLSSDCAEALSVLRYLLWADNYNLHQMPASSYETMTADVAKAVVASAGNVCLDSVQFHLQA